MARASATVSPSLAAAPRARSAPDPVSPTRTSQGPASACTSTISPASASPSPSKVGLDQAPTSVRSGPTIAALTANDPMSMPRPCVMLEPSSRPMRGG